MLDSLALPFRQDTYFQTEGPGNTARVVGLVARELCGMAQERALAVRGGVNLIDEYLSIFLFHGHRPTHIHNTQLCI